MAQCSVCTHVEVTLINGELLSGASVRDVGKRFGLKKSSIYRHKTGCLAPQVAEAADAKKELSIEAILNNVETLQKEARGILEKTLESGDHRVALLAIQAGLKCLDTLGRMISLAQAQRRLEREQGDKDNQGIRFLIGNLGPEEEKPPDLYTVEEPPSVEENDSGKNAGNGGTIPESQPTVPKQTWAQSLAAWQRRTCLEDETNEG